VWDSKLIALAYDAALDTKGWLDFVEALERSVGGVVVVLAIPQPSASHRGELIAPSVGSDFTESYRQRYFALDPWTEQASSLAPGSLVSGRSACRSGRFSGSAFFRNWMEPQGLVAGSFLGCVVDQDEKNGVSLLSVFRRRDAGALGAGIRLLSPDFVSHLRRAVQLHFRRLQLEAERDGLAAAFDRVPIAAIVADGRGLVRAANRAAERLLGARDGLALGRDGLHADRPEDTIRLRQALAAATGSDDSAGCGIPLRLERGSGRRPLRALVRRLRARIADAAAPSPFVALFVDDPEEHVAPPAELLRSFFGLTVAESALARELSNGHSLAEAARRLEITYGTARQRLGQVFAKTGTTRQAELVHLLLTGPESLLAEE
jgi:DNA-binding CsgD family transcriptional regulator/PAS domain-containing protein